MKNKNFLISLFFNQLSVIKIDLKYTVLLSFFNRFKIINKFFFYKKKKLLQNKILSPVNSVLNFPLNYINNLNFLNLLKDFLETYEENFLFFLYNKNFYFYENINDINLFDWMKILINKKYKFLKKNNNLILIKKFYLKFLKVIYIIKNANINTISKK